MAPTNNRGANNKETNMKMKTIVSVKKNKRHLYSDVVKKCKS
jgi:hypothetical protein